MYKMLYSQLFLNFIYIVNITYVMNPFYRLFINVVSSPYYDHMMKFVAPLYDHLGINHFWYYKITSSGNYSYLGIHAKWSEFCFENNLLCSFPCLRHPDTIQSGISLMKATSNMEYQKVLETAWNKFHINFNLNLTEKISDGIEAFGFACRFNDPKADERLLNDLPFLRAFIKSFKSKHSKIFQLLEDNQIDLAAQFGSVFYEGSRGLTLPCKRDALLQKMGFAPFFSLTPREVDVLKFIVHGYPAAFIAKNLGLRIKTIENYLSTIKCKLACDSKTQLIEKAREMHDCGLL